jgi:hypothetical protein
MRNIMQLVGGVVVAGAVAAGSTAFTATGLTKGGSVNNFVGGKVTQTVVGAQLTNMTFTTSTFVADAATEITAVKLVFDPNTPTGAVVTMTATGSPGGTPSAGFYCSAVADISSSQASNCTIGTAVGTPANGHFTNLTGVEITVTAAA